MFPNFTPATDEMINEAMDIISKQTDLIESLQESIKLKDAVIDKQDEIIKLLTDKIEGR